MLTGQRPAHSKGPRTHLEEETVAQPFLEGGGTLRPRFSVIQVAQTAESIERTQGMVSDCRKRAPGTGVRRGPSPVRSPPSLRLASTSVSIWSQAPCSPTPGPSARTQLLATADTVGVWPPCGNKDCGKVWRPLGPLASGEVELHSGYFRQTEQPCACACFRTDFSRLSQGHMLKGHVLPGFSG